jgi:hypothetical protein
MLRDTPFGKFYSETQAEADAFVLLETKRLRVKQLHDEINSRLLAIAAKYPERERETWHEQYREALALAADSNATTPILTAAAMSAGITVADLADAVIANAQAWSGAVGAIVGDRIKREAEIHAATEFQDEADGPG